MHIEINGQKVGLKVSMWMTDAGRLQKLWDKEPDSNIWKAAVLLFLAYKNNCRYLKQEPVLTIEDFDLYVDEQYSDIKSRKPLTDLILEITGEMNELSRGEEISEDDDLKKKKLIGAEFTN